MLQVGWLDAYMEFGRLVLPRLEPWEQQKTNAFLFLLQQIKPPVDDAKQVAKKFGKDNTDDTDDLMELKVGSHLRLSAPPLTPPLTAPRVHLLLFNVRHAHRAVSLGGFR